MEKEAGVSSFPMGQILICIMVKTEPTAKMEPMVKTAKMAKMVLTVKMVKMG